MVRWLRTLVGSAAVLLAAMPAFAQRTATPQAPDRVEKPPGEAVEPELARDIHEQIDLVGVTLRLPDGKPHTGTMVVTHFRPAGNGPFPVVVFSHGRNSGTRHEPARWRAISFARYWTRRGFAVVVPTRVGYGEQGQAVDPEAAGACNNADFRPAVEAMSTQIERAVAHARTLPRIDGSRVILSGVSYGGFATIAAGARQIPGVIAGINFVGGLGGNPKARPGEPCQGARVTAMAAELGARSRVPMLWLYAHNDSYWGKDWPQRWFDAYTGAGGKARLASFAAVGEEGHKLMSGGFPLWRPVLDRFVASLGFKVPAAATSLPDSGFAALDDASRLPHVKPAVREEAWPKFLAADVPRAFAIAPNGAWAWRSGLDAVEVALSRCHTNARGPCALYAADDRVVWKGK